MTIYRSDYLRFLGLFTVAARKLCGPILVLLFFCVLPDSIAGLPTSVSHSTNTHLGQVQQSWALSLDPSVPVAWLQILNHPYVDFVEVFGFVSNNQFFLDIRLIHRPHTYFVNYVDDIVSYLDVGNIDVDPRLAMLPGRSTRGWVGIRLRYSNNNIDELTNYLDAINGYLDGNQFMADGGEHFFAIVHEIHRRIFPAQVAVVPDSTNSSSPKKDEPPSHFKSFGSVEPSGSGIVAR